MGLLFLKAKLFVESWLNDEQTDASQIIITQKILVVRMVNSIIYERI
jgi:hypothetical protein